MRNPSLVNSRKSGKTEIGTSGIKKTLKRYNPLQSIAEYVWNGFDAGASVVNIDIQRGNLEAISAIEVSDDGSGIPFSKLDEKFRPFMHSNKTIDPRDNSLNIHGQNGRGRLTFFTFSDCAQWNTIYKDKNGQSQRYEIKIKSNFIDDWNAEDQFITNDPTGTRVFFSNIFGLNEDFESDLSNYICHSFASFLESKTPFERKIFINKRELNYSHLIAKRKSFSLKIEGNEFNVNYVRWSEKINNQYSKFYFIDSLNLEKFRENTSYNNKGDNFYHSVYVRGNYFDNLSDDFSLSPLQNLSPDLDIFKGAKNDVLKELISRLDKFLYKRRRAFLREHSAKLVEKFKDDKIFPTFSSNPWDQHRLKDLEEVVKDVYEVEPRIFNGLNLQQKQTMVHLFSLAMDSSERDGLLNVISHVIKLPAKEREELSKILKSSQLSNIIATIKLIGDRVAAIDELNSLVFNPDFAANERDHLQSFIEHHYWIFGEQYHLVTSAEPKFERALRRFVHLLRKEDLNVKIEHRSKNREMDLFAVRCIPNSNQLDCIVVEIKHPDIKLGKHELDQVLEYMSVVVSADEFNGKNIKWQFFLVGNSFDKHVQNQINFAKSHGKPGLVFQMENYEVFVATWSEVLTNFEIRHNFLLERLKVERDKLATEKTSADEILERLHENSASSIYSVSPTVPLIA